MTITAAMELRKMIAEARNAGHDDPKALHLLLCAERSLDAFDYDGAGMRYAQAMDLLLDA
jgi:hypothetical protein